MTAPRLLGLWLGGTTGCYLALVIWYAIFCSAHYRHIRLPIRADERLASDLSRALPLFAFSITWIGYLVSSRWFSSIVTPSTTFGYMAFAINNCAILIGTISTIAQAYYPHILNLIAQGKRSETADLILSQSTYLAGFLFLTLSVGLPFAAYALPHLLPSYAPALIPSLFISLSVIPLSLATWAMPLLLSVTRHILRDLLVFFGLCGSGLASAVWIGADIAGLTGQSIGMAMASFLPVLCLGLYFVHYRLLTKPHMLRVLGLCVGLSLLLAGEIALIIHHTFFTRVAHPVDGSPFSIRNLAIADSGRMRLIFSDEFDRLSLVDENGFGRWDPIFPWGGKTISQNGERQYYVDPRPNGDPALLQRLTPISVKDGRLHLRARKLTSEEQNATQGLPYVSGLLTTAQSFSFTYGYVEIRARAPKGAGLWPAIWLLPVSLTWPPELDLFEAIGSKPDRYYASLHSREKGFKIDNVNAIATYDLSTQFSIFGLRWTRTTIQWLFNGKVVAETETPSDFHQPMYLLMNLAVDGAWAGAPDPDTSSFSDFLIDYIRVYEVK